MIIREGKISNCAALSIFLFKMSKLSQELYNITISMLVNGASIDAVAENFNVNRNIISRLQTRFLHAGTVCDRQGRG